MKKQAYTMLAMIFLVGSMAVAAQAQTSGRTQLVANIPFEFSVGSETLPAGEYRVLALSPQSSNVVLQIQSRDGKSGAMLLQMMTIEGKAQETAKLIFNRYGNRYFIAQVWVDGTNTGWQAPKSRAERAIKRELARVGAKTETVALTPRR